MAELLTSSLLWRVLLAIGGWFSALAHSSKVLTFLGRTWRSSRTRAAKRFERLNVRLAARHGLKDCLDHSLLCRIWRFFVRCGQNSRLFSWLFSDGLHGVILFALSMYVVIDYVLRDLLAVPVLSSCWDECLHIPDGLLRSHERRHAVLLHPDLRLPRDGAVHALVLPRHAPRA